MKVRRAVKRPVRASKKLGTRPSTKRIVAEDEIIEDEIVDDTVDDAGDVDDGEAIVDPAATDLLFEAEDVAELVAEVTGDVVEVAVDDEADTVVFTVGEGDAAEEFTVEPDGDEEVLEAATKKTVGKKPVKASRTIARKRRTVRK